MMAKYNRSDKDIIAVLQRQVKELAHRVHQLENTKTTTVAVKDAVPIVDRIAGEIFTTENGKMRWARDDSLPYLDVLAGIIISGTIDFIGLPAHSGAQEVIDLTGSPYADFIEEGDWVLGPLSRPEFPASRGTYFYAAPSIQPGLQIIVHGFNADSAPIDQPTAGAWRFLVMKPGAWVD
jgi:hypothetical protein